MKRLAFAGILLLLSLLSSFAQRDVKDPNQIGACINITTKLAASLNAKPIVDGMVPIWTADEVRLMAVVSEQRVDGRKKRRIDGWRVLDLGGGVMTSDESSRDRPRGGRTVRQRIVYTRGTNPEGCFVVEQTRVRQMKKGAKSDFSSPAMFELEDATGEAQTFDQLAYQLSLACRQSLEQ